MSLLMRASEVAKRPVVTYAGEDVAQVKDIVYAGSGRVAGFTLNGRGLLSGPKKESLTWTAVAALGPDAVMISSDSVLADRRELEREVADDGGGDVLGSQVLTDDGRDIGKVSDVVIEVTDAPAPRADVVGYEIEPSEAMGKDAKKVLVPLPDTLAASGEHLIVPASALDFVSHDLAGFGAAMASFRTRLAEGTPS